LKLQDVHKINKSDEETFLVMLFNLKYVLLREYLTKRHDKSE